MTTDPFEYDVALSFAGADKAAAEQLARLLDAKNIRVFSDEYTSGDVWGNDVIDHLVNLYARKARYCVLLLSQQYPLKTWTEADRTSAGERALRDADEYILPFLLDDSVIPGIASAQGYRDLRQSSMEEIVNWLEQKLRETKRRAGPPPESHDLRSGNVPSSS